MEDIVSCPPILQPWAYSQLRQVSGGAFSFWVCLFLVLGSVVVQEGVGFSHHHPAPNTNPPIQLPSKLPSQNENTPTPKLANPSLA